MGCVNRAFYQGSRGFSLIEVMVAIVIGSIVTLAAFTFLLNNNKTLSEQDKLFWLTARRSQIQNIIRSPNGWNGIVANNASLNCFAGGTSCSAYSTAPQPLKIPIENAVLDGTKPGLGMTSRGDFCENFDPLKQNPDCPIGIKLSWVALCDDASCLHAQPKVQVQFNTSQESYSIHNIQSFNMVVFKDPKLDSLYNVCTSLGGVLSGVNCTIPALASKCDPANTLGLGPTYPLGFDGSGEVICGRPTPGNCGASDVAVGINANGGVICAPQCP